MSIGLHCRLARPGRVAGIADFLDYCKSYKKEVWFCTREQIADFWHENHYPRGGGSPVRDPLQTAFTVEGEDDVKIDSEPGNGHVYAPPSEEAAEEVGDII